MRRRDFSSRQIRHSPLHIARHGPRQNTISRSKNIQRGLRNTLPRLLRQLQIILIIDPASPIPIARTANPILLKLLHVILEFFLIEERRGGNSVFLVPDHIQLDPFLGRHKFSAAARFASIHSLEELSNRSLILHDVFDLTILGAELQLIAELRKSGLAESFGADKVLCGRSIGCADAENVRDELRIPLRHAIDYCSTPEMDQFISARPIVCQSAAERTSIPIVTSNNDLMRADFLRNGSNGVGVSFEAILFQVGRSSRLAITHAV